MIVLRRRRPGDAFRVTPALTLGEAVVRTMRFPSTSVGEA
jgi:hypothetical protein